MAQAQDISCLPFVGEILERFAINTMTVQIRFCHTCGFRYKAAWLADKLAELMPGTQIISTPVDHPLGSFVVSVNGEVIYEKSRSFHGSNPQPTPTDIEELVKLMAPRGLTAEELADFRELHQAQIVAGPSPPWSVKIFNPRTGSPRRDEERKKWCFW